MNEPVKPMFDDARINLLGQGFCDKSLPANAFDNAAHWAVACWLLTQMPVQQVAAQMPGLIKAFNLAKGGQNTASEGYHETITLASIAAAADFRARHREMALCKQVNTLLGTELGRHDWMLQHWQKGTLFSVEARAVWVPPDLRALPFDVCHPGKQAA